MVRINQNKKYSKFKTKKMSFDKNEVLIGAKSVYNPK